VPDPKLAQFGDQNYISLETFKKNGQGVKTPVWFVLHKNAFYAYTEADSWKVKRIPNNPRVRVGFATLAATSRARGSKGDERLAADKLLDRRVFPEEALQLSLEDQSGTSGR